MIYKTRSNLGDKSEERSIDISKALVSCTISGRVLHETEFRQYRVGWFSSHVSGRALPATKLYIPSTLNIDLIL